jgi:hypothetical protein
MRALGTCTNRRDRRWHHPGRCPTPPLPLPHRHRPRRWRQHCPRGHFDPHQTLGHWLVAGRPGDVCHVVQREARSLLVRVRWAPSPPPLAHQRHRSPPHCRSPDTHGWGWRVSGIREGHRERASHMGNSCGGLMQQSHQLLPSQNTAATPRRVECSNEERPVPETCVNSLQAGGPVGTTHTSRRGGAEGAVSTADSKGMLSPCGPQQTTHNIPHNTKGCLPPHKL